MGCATLGGVPNIVAPHLSWVLVDDSDHSHHGALLLHQIHTRSVRVGGVSEAVQPMEVARIN